MPLLWVIHNALDCMLHIFSYRKSHCQSCRVFSSFFHKYIKRNILIKILFRPGLTIILNRVFFVLAMITVHHCTSLYHLNKDAALDWSFSVMMMALQMTPGFANVFTKSPHYFLREHFETRRLIWQWRGIKAQQLASQEHYWLNLTVV